MNPTFKEAVGLAVGMLSILSIIGAALGVYVHLTVKTLLAEFLVQLNGTYVRAAVYREHSEDTERRLVVLER